jgi:aspartate carbamoyltransferase catalytic subunit
MGSGVKISTSHNDLIGIRGMSVENLNWILGRSTDYMKRLDASGAITFPEILKGLTVANLFFENSTRTRSSFELAEKRLGASVLSLSMQTSSLTKGESLIDTVKVITAMKIDAVVVRHRSPGVPELLRKHLPNDIRILNAGDGANEHPTQALLDAATLIENFGSVKGKHIAIIGDITHSRVARSNVHLLKKLGANITIVAPTTLVPSTFSDVFEVPVSQALDTVLPSCDAVIMLRIQRERQDKGLLPNVEEFRELYGMTAKRYAAHPSLLVLHPGPVNRGVELDDEALDGERSLVFRQVKRGVAIRMAVLEWIFAN